MFQDTWRSNKENSSIYWGETLTRPLMASNYATPYLVPISFWMLTLPLYFLSYLVLQECIAFCSVSDKSGASMFLPCSRKNAVAHINKKNTKTKFSRDCPGILGGFCLCVFLPIRNDPKKNTHINRICHPHSPGTIPLICLCLCVFSFPEFRKRKEKPSLVGEREFGRHIKRQFG